MHYLVYMLKTMFCLCLFGFSCAGEEGVYIAKQINQEINIDGLDSEEVWANATLLGTFSYPWQNSSSPKTTFRAFHDSEYLNFIFHAVDGEIILKQTGDEEMDAVKSDRVEIFIKSEDDSMPYYSFEMDPQGRVFDSKGEFGKYIDQEYDFPRGGLSFKGKIDQNHYSLEGRLDLKILQELNLINSDNSLMIGLYRGEYFTVDGKEKTHWISWVIPDSETPNFHIPSSFGKIILQ